MGEIYKWDNPYEWLAQKVYTEWENRRLMMECIQLAGRLDADTLQDMYQEEMEKDGYFETIKT